MPYQLLRSVQKYRSGLSMSSYNGADTKKGFAFSGSFLWNGNIPSFRFHLQNILYYLRRRKRGQIWNTKKVKSSEVFTPWHNINDTQGGTQGDIHIYMCVCWMVHISVHHTGLYNKYTFYNSIILARWFSLSDAY